MMHPDLKEPVFAEWYGSPLLLAAVEQLLHTKHEDLQLGKLFIYCLAYLCPRSLKILVYLELFNLLINPQDSDFDLTWHRDAIKAEASEEEESEKLKIPHYGTQWNT